MPLNFTDHPITKLSLNNRGLGPLYTPVGSVVVTGLTPHASTAWVEIFPAERVTSDIHELLLAPILTALSATLTDAMVDIGIGPAGSEVPLISNIPVGWGASGSAMALRLLKLPIFIPAYTRLSFRARSLETSKTVELQVLAKGFTERPATCFRGIDVIGANAAASIGTRLTSGNSGAAGTWTSIGSITAREYHSVFPFMQGVTSTSMTSIAYEVEIGIGSTLLAGSDKWRFHGGTSEIMFGPIPNWWHDIYIAPRQQLQMRGSASGTSQSVDAVIFAGYLN